MTDEAREILSGATAGETDEPYGDRDNWTSCIHLPGHGSAIECCGSTKEKAEARRDAILSLLSQPPNDTQSGLIIAGDSQKVTQVPDGWLWRRTILEEGWKYAGLDEAEFIERIKEYRYKGESVYEVKEIYFAPPAPTPSPASIRNAALEEAAWMIEFNVKGCSPAWFDGIKFTADPSKGLRFPNENSAKTLFDYLHRERYIKFGYDCYCITEHAWSALKSTPPQTLGVERNSTLEEILQDVSDCSSPAPQNMPFAWAFKNGNGSWSICHVEQDVQPDNKHEWRRVYIDALPEGQQLEQKQLLVTMTISVDRDREVYSDLQTHDNSYAEVALGIAGIRDEINRVIKEQHNCPYYPKNVQESRNKIVRECKVNLHPNMPQNVPDDVVRDAMVKRMVDRFLGWKLPKTFSPDGGISFKSEYNEDTDYPMRHEPVGTNLFNADEARAMVEYMLDTAISQPTAQGEKK